MLRRDGQRFDRRTALRWIRSRCAHTAPSGTDTRPDGARPAPPHNRGRSTCRSTAPATTLCAAPSRRSSGQTRLAFLSSVRALATLHRGRGRHHARRAPAARSAPAARRARGDPWLPLPVPTAVMIWAERLSWLVWLGVAVALLVTVCATVATPAFIKRWLRDGRRAPALLVWWHQWSSPRPPGTSRPASHRRRAALSDRHADTARPRPPARRSGASRRSLQGLPRQGACTPLRPTRPGRRDLLHSRAGLARARDAGFRCRRLSRRRGVGRGARRAVARPCAAAGARGHGHCSVRSSR